MVNNEGQLYTMEGIAAALLILFTTYIVLTSTTIITPGETHISDMQLETLGNDVLAIMDTPASASYDAAQTLQFDPSDLETYVNLGTAGAPGFNSRFLALSNAMYDPVTVFKQDRIKCNAKVYYRNANSVGSVDFSGSKNYRENAVVVTRWVNTKTGAINPTRNEPQTVLLEVTLWRE
ncbi:MAG: hypothetical protein WCK53_16325 [Methanomicrobiales archaeon]